MPPQRQSVKVSCVVLAPCYVVARMCYKSKKSRYGKGLSFRKFINFYFLIAEFCLVDENCTLITEKNNSTPQQVAQFEVSFKFTVQMVWDRLQGKV